MSKQTRQRDNARKERQNSFVQGLKDRIKDLEQKLIKSSKHAEEIETELHNAEEARDS